MKKTAASQYDAAASISQEKTAERARALWESYGRPVGRDTEIWLEAERQLLGVDAEIEGSGGISVAAPQFDEAVSGEQPVTREAPPANAKPRAAKKAQVAEKPAKSATSAPRQIKSKTKVAEDTPKIAKKKTAAATSKSTGGKRGRA